MGGSGKIESRGYFSHPGKRVTVTLEMEKAVDLMFALEQKTKQSPELPDGLDLR